jgi:regulatory protein
MSDSQNQSSVVLIITSIKKVSVSSYELIFEAGPSFFISERYLGDIQLSEIEPGASFSGQKLETLLHCGFCYACEKAAFTYLDRAEQNRFNLTLKLKKKGHQPDIIEKVLDNLEAENYLSDLRFASSWVRARMSSHAEGKSKLLSLLMQRGISIKDSQKAVEVYFENVSEEEVLSKAVQKCIRLGYSKEKIQKKLYNDGFSIKIINSYIKNLEILEKK